MRNRYQRRARKSNKFEVVAGRELALRVPLPLVEMWADLQAGVERRTGLAGLHILQAILEGEVRQRVGPPYQPEPGGTNVRWGRQPGYVVFGGQKIAVERPRVRTRSGEEVEQHRSPATGRTPVLSFPRLVLFSRGR